LEVSEALKTFRLAPGLEIELVVAEPLVTDPVAIDWAADGSLWVCEMGDYPAGLDGQWLPGGRIRHLRDLNGDGVYEDSRIFLAGLPFPTGLMVWRRGVLICAAPDIVYAEDTDGDGRADRVEKLFTGFATDNFQARVNGLSLGLDNWIHGANGLLGGTITQTPNTVFGASAAGSAVNLRNRDFRFRPRDGLMEVTSGLTQQGRVRDDWGNWFGCDNSRLLQHYPWNERYLGRNPQVTLPASERPLTGGPGGNLLFPASRLLERFNDPEHANRVTSACGLGLYRDDLFGGEWEGNAFICEPVHNLVHRELLSLKDGVASSRRAPGEEATEFLASTDHWFRPAQARTGPDGALYVVDMYRFLIEHPRWIPAARLAQIDVRAGSDRGRIYRVRPEGKALRPVRDLTRMKPVELAMALDHPNGIERDRVHGELLFRGGDEPELNRALEGLARDAGLSRVRVQALSVLEGLGGLREGAVTAALQDPDARVRRHAVGLAEAMLKDSSRSPSRSLLPVLLGLVNDPSPWVRQQLAFTLGELEDPAAGEALAVLAATGVADAGLRVAVLTSAVRHAEPILRAVLALDEGRAGRDGWIPTLIATMAADDRDAAARARALALVLPSVEVAPSPVQWDAFLRLVDGWDREGIDAWHRAHPDDDAGRHWRSVVDQARRRAVDEAMSMEERRQAIRVVAGAGRETSDRELLVRLAATDAGDAVRQAALDGLRRLPETKVADRLLEQWARSLPMARAGILGLLLDRPEWSGRLLEAVASGRVMKQEVPPAFRQRLMSSPDAAVRARMGEVFPQDAVGSRGAVTERYLEEMTGAGDPERGREVFVRACSTCHVLDGIGHEVGPDLAPLRGKDPGYWLMNILDPNAAVEPRFVMYSVELHDGSNLSGLIRSETATGLTVVSGGGTIATVARSQIRGLAAATESMMPEGLEEGIVPGEMGDLIAFLRLDPGADAVGSGGVKAAELVLRDAASVARFVLDASQGEVARSTAIRANPQFAGALIREMTRDLVAGTPEEYRRIPWIWQVSIAAGRRNDDGHVRDVIAASLPGLDEPLRDWQAVVLGGGIINGISQRRLWPGERIGALLKGHPELEAGWRRALDEAARMADDAGVPQGTRYDALRMLGVESWERRGQQLIRYLAAGTSAELQMGAVSGLGDMPGTGAGEALIGSLAHLTGDNRKLALDALMRDGMRHASLRAAVEGKRVGLELLDDERLRELRGAASPLED